LSLTWTCCRDMLGLFTGRQGFVFWKVRKRVQPLRAASGRRDPQNCVEEFAWIS
jgi:hypothetical protein